MNCMNEFTDIKPDTDVKESEYKRLLGFPHHYEPDGRANELADWARQWYKENGNPWVYGININDLDLSKERLSINGVEFTSKKLHHQLAKAEAQSVMLVIVSAGKECEEMALQLWEEGKPDEYFFLEIYGSAVVEHLITTTGFRFCEWADQNQMAVLPHYSPGYPGWNIEDQNRLFKLIQKNKTKDLTGKINVLETGMLNPKKSMLALFGVTKYLDKVRNLRELIPCQMCSLQSCQYRRVSYQHSRNQIEDVTNLQPVIINDEHLSYQSVLTQNAKYQVSLKALQKWSKERLHLKFLDDFSVEAMFKYEGSTCSNMGRSLKFDYKVKLSSSGDRYKINSMSCSPSANDDGYLQMCEYIRDSDSLLNKIENEKPLLGKPLDDVLNWKYQFSPEGCHCNAESREHKWGLVFEAIHYSLTQQNEQNI